MRVLGIKLEFYTKGMLLTEEPSLQAQPTGF